MTELLIFVPIVLAVLAAPALLLLDEHLRRRRIESAGDAFLEELESWADAFEEEVGEAFERFEHTRTLRQDDVAWELALEPRAGMLVVSARHTSYRAPTGCSAIRRRGEPIDRHTIGLMIGEWLETYGVDEIEHAMGQRWWPWNTWLDDVEIRADEAGLSVRLVMSNARGSSGMIEGLVEWVRATMRALSSGLGETREQWLEVADRLPRGGRPLRAAKLMEERLHAGIESRESLLERVIEGGEEELWMILASPDEYAQRFDDRLDVEIVSLHDTFCERRRAAAFTRGFDAYMGDRLMRASPAARSEVWTTSKFATARLLSYPGDRKALFECFEDADLIRVFGKWTWSKEDVSELFEHILESIEVEAFAGVEVEIAAESMLLDGWLSRRPRYEAIDEVFAGRFGMVSRGQRVELFRRLSKEPLNRFPKCVLTFMRSSEMPDEFAELALFVRRVPADVLETEEKAVALMDALERAEGPSMEALLEALLERSELERVRVEFSRRLRGAGPDSRLREMVELLAGRRGFEGALSVSAGVEGGLTRAGESGALSAPE